jgi:phage-related protein
MNKVIRRHILAALCALPITSAAGNDPDLPGEVLVKLGRTADLQPLLSRHRLTLVSQFGARPIYRLKVIGTRRLGVVLDALALEPSVQITTDGQNAQKVFSYTPQETPPALKEAQRKAGYQLRLVQQGKEPDDFKPMPSVGPGAYEIRVQLGDAYRVFYVVKFEEAVYVLHAFHKKTQKMPHKEIETAEKRQQDFEARDRRQR